MSDVKILVLGAIDTNCYLIMEPDRKEGILIDPAAEPEKIMQLLQQEQCKLAAILLTHGHFDHILAAKTIAEQCNTSIYASQEEAALLDDPQKNCSAGMGLAARLKADYQTVDGEELSLAGFFVQVLHTPGHTKGGNCYYFAKQGWLFSGDTLFFESIGRTDLPTGDPKELVQSIRQKLFCLPEETVVFPGHGRQTTIGHEKY